MATLRTTSSLLADGYTYHELRRMVRRQDLVRVRRGAYDQCNSELSTEAQHARLVAATMPLVAGDAVVSHRSAAVLHGLPLLHSVPDRVELTRSTAAGGKLRARVHLHAAPLPAVEVTEIAGVPVTSLARTVVDLARSLPYADAVVIGDAALHAGLAPELLQESAGMARRRPGIAGARRALAFTDGRSESPGETLSRIEFHRAGLPAPESQFVVLDSSGRLVGRTDFGWEEHRVLGEFDGKIKYGRLLKPGQSIEDVVYAEKLREDALRDLGWLVIRWVWADLYRRGVLADRVRRAFARAGRSGGSLP